ncbi:hypothetical protein BDP27DRAFT_1417991 [Rhodocollybia butyracea]|uniref:Uncharacterized protein n=1 Tax=Rhodocollybia butyracea TaxID=206335 RepID=A0A9P5UB24_9AGAR|nr:hypothetical protein BDP27DRAFT_1417991 [Rhodocollybia butyracea]
MFSFFRKPATSEPTKSIEDSLAETSASRNRQLRTPSPSVNSTTGKNLSPPGRDTAPFPPITPSPPPDNLLDKELGLITDPAALHALITSVPPKTLHEYTLAHLIPPARSSKPIHPPSSLTLTHLTSFFSSLSPPPRLHCVRCHKFYYDVENAERSCLVPHDDDSALVERVGGKGVDTQYQTLWNCCSQTVDGDGDMGPPDGWCYEGKHTTDTKRARFRADSSLHDDKLTSCDRLKCYDPVVSDDGSESSTTSSRRPRKRKRSTRKREAAAAAAAEQNPDDPPTDDDTQSVPTHSRPRKKLKSPPIVPSSPLVTASPSASASASTSRPRKKRAKATHDDKPFKPESTPADDDDMDVDDSASVVSKRAPKSSRATKASAPISTSTSQKGGKLKAAMKPASSKSKAHTNSISTVEFATSPSPRSSSPVRGHGQTSGDERHRKHSVSFADAPMEESISRSGSTKSTKPRSNARPRTKKLEEVVASSVDGEMPLQ